MQRSGGVQIEVTMERDDFPDLHDDLECHFVQSSFRLFSIEVGKVRRCGVRDDEQEHES